MEIEAGRRMRQCPSWRRTFVCRGRGGRKEGPSIDRAFLLVCLQHVERVSPVNVSCSTQLLLLWMMISMITHLSSSMGHPGVEKHTTKTRISHASYPATRDVSILQTLFAMYFLCEKGVPSAKSSSLQAASLPPPAPNGCCVCCHVHPWSVSDRCP